GLGLAGAINVPNGVAFNGPEKSQAMLGNGLATAPDEREHDPCQQDEHQEREQARQVLEQEIHQRVGVTLHDGSMALHRWEKQEKKQMKTDGAISVQRRLDAGRSRTVAARF